MNPRVLRYLFTSASDIGGVERESLRAFMNDENGAMPKYYTHATKDLDNKVVEQLFSILHPNK